MHEKLKALYEQRMKLHEDSKALLDKVDSENRKLTAEENQHWDKMAADIDAIGTEIERREQLAKRESMLTESRGRKADASDPSPEPRRSAKPNTETRGELAYPLRFAQQCGAAGQTGERKFAFAGPTAEPGYGDDFRSYLRGAERSDTLRVQAALRADDDTSGGYAVAPQQFVANLIKFVDDAVFIRQMSTVIQVPMAQSLGAPSLDTDIADSDWTSELATGSEDSSMAFGKRELTPHPLAKRIKVSNKLLRISALGMEALVNQRMAYKFGVSEEKAFLTGTGSGQPLGVFTASSLGISTGRDVSTDNTTTAMTADGIINAFYSLKSQYQERAAWMFHRDGIKQIRKLKDGEGQYMWQPGMQAGQPSLILGRPYMQSEFSPNTFTTGLYVGIVGDWSFYWIAESLGMTVQRLVELYAEANQVGFIGRMELDAMPVLEEAFARVKLA